MENMQEFLNMGGYAGFVWPALGVTFALMVGLAIWSRGQLKAGERVLAELEAELRARDGAS